MDPIFWAGVGIFAAAVTLSWLTSRPPYIVILAAIAVWWALLLSGVGS